ncbi:MAG: hypothetical protein VX715_06245 [Planctomycetota bacterium]|nr:hypothetical protein [Planctomycetota bacterium]
MADNETDNEVTGDTPGTSTRKSSEDCIKLVPYPKIVFMYPTLVLSLIVAICLSVVGEPRAELTTPAAETEQAETNQQILIKETMIKQGVAVFLSLVFLGIFFINLLVLTFDFPRSHSLTLVISLLSIFLGLVLLSQWKPGLLGGVTTWISSLQPMANATFYWIIFSIGMVIAIAVKVVVKFDYWEIRPNEILHHHGLWGNLKRYSAPHVRIDKEVNDVFEYMLLGAGRLILQPSGEQRAFVLDNVLRITQREEEITKLLGVLKVDVRDD